MKYAFAGMLLVVVSIGLALDGQVGIHDPPTIVQRSGFLDAEDNPLKMFGVSLVD